MAESNEQAMIRLGMDLKQFEQGTLRMLAINENAQAKLKAADAETKRYYDKLLSDRAAEQQAYLDKQITMAKEYQAETIRLETIATAELRASIAQREAARLAEIETVKNAQLEANEQIIASERARNAASMMVLGANKERNAARTLETSASGVGNFGAGVNVVEEAEGAATGMRSTIALREAQTMVREVMRGNWTRILGSFTIFAQAFGGVMRKIMASMFSFTGMIIGAAAYTAYSLYNGIKEYGKNIDAQLKLDSERVVDRIKARNEAMTDGIKKAVELEGKIRSLTNAHETLADKMEREVRAMDRYLSFQEKFIAASGKMQLAAVSLAAATGMITPDEARQQRAQIQSNTTVSAQTARMDTILKEGEMLRAAQKQLADSEPGLREAARDAESRVTGVDANGHVVNQAAFDREKRMKGYTAERSRLEADIQRAEQEKAKAEAGGDSWAVEHAGLIKGIAYWSGIGALTAGIEKATGHEISAPGKDVTQADLSEQYSDFISKAKKREAQLDAANEKDVAAKTEYSEAAQEALKALTENTDGTKSLNKQIDEYTKKLGDQVEGMKAFYMDLQTQKLTTAIQIQQQAASEGLQVPSLSDLASGGGWLTREKKRHARAMRSGSSPYTGAARDAIWWKNAEEEDLRMGNGGFVDDGTGTGHFKLTGQAEIDRKNAVIAENKLEAAFGESPAAREKVMKEKLVTIDKTLADLLAAATAKGIIISDAAPTGS